MLWRLLFVLAVSGCASLERNRNAYLIKEIDAPISDIRSIANTILPAGLRAISQNGREMVSRHFIAVGENRFKPAGDALERYFAKITILGDRRPYDIEVLVTHERRVLRGESFTYAIVGYNLSMAKDLERKLRGELTKRLEDRNVIDDFRVF